MIFEGPKIKWFWAGVVLLAAAAIIFTFEGRRLTISDQDLAYHLQTAQAFVRAGGIPLWSFWTSVPFGAAHVYPPLVHLFVSLLVISAVPPAIIPAVMAALALWLCLVLSWWGLCLLFDPETAFWYLGAILTTSPVLLEFGQTIPASFVFAAVPILIFFMHRGRWLGATIILALMFYSHRVVPWFVVAALIGASWQFPQWRRLTRRVVTGAIILFLPWLVHMALHLEKFRYVHPEYLVLQPVRTYVIPLIGSALALIGLWWFARVWRQSNIAPLTRYALSCLAALFIVQVPLLLYHFPNRFTLAGGIVVAFMIGAWTLATVRPTLPRSGRWIIFIAFVVGLLIAPTLYVSTAQFTVIPRRGLLSSLVRPYQDAFETLGSGPSFFNMPYYQLGPVIAATTSPEDVLYVATNRLDVTVTEDENRFLIGQFWSAAANRAMGNRYPSEYFRYLETPFPIEKAGIVIADYRQTDEFHGTKTFDDQIIARTLRQQFVKIAEQDRTVVYKNKHLETALKSEPQGPVVPFAVAWLLVALGIWGIWRDRPQQRITTSELPR